MFEDQSGIALDVIEGSVALGGEFEQDHATVGAIDAAGISELFEAIGDGGDGGGGDAQPTRQ